MDTRITDNQQVPGLTPGLNDRLDRMVQMRAPEAPVNPDLQKIDEAIKEDDARIKGIRQKHTEGEKKEPSRLSKLPALLRFVGAVTLIASAATFMVQGWPEMDHLMRYYSFLGFTLLLTAAGFFCGLRLKEDKGARTFLATAATVIPVHFAQLGALIYSQFPEQNINYPVWLHWVAPSKASAFATTIAGVLALIPIVFISFSTLARSEARKLTALYMTANMLLLIPIRSSGLVSIIALISFVQFAIVEIGYASRQSVLRTKEGYFIRTMLAVPFFLIIARALNLYDVTLTFYSMNMATVAILFFVLLPHYISDRETAAGVQMIATIPAFFAWLLMASEITLHGIPELAHYMGLLVGLPFAALLVVMSVYALEYNSAYHKGAALVAAFAICIQLATYPGVIASLFCISIGVMLMAYGFTSEQRTVLVAGTVSFVSGLLYHVRYAIELYNYSPWISLALVGVVVVLLSSVLERNHGRLSARLQELKNVMAR
jgi:hypothetical protein